MRTFTRKGFGRIYVDKKENIQKVAETIKEMDEFEFDYLPDKMIATIGEYPDVVYTHKFDSLNLDLLTVECYNKGITIICIDNGTAETMSNRAEPRTFSY